MFTLMGINASYKAENKGASNVNDAPLLALDASYQNLTSHDDASEKQGKRWDYKF